MQFLIDFLIYLAAFAVGAGLTWLVVGRIFPLRTAQAAQSAFEVEAEGSQP
jgi:K+-transporting ATPase c subunit